MDTGIILTAAGAVLATVGLVYGFLRNFKIDINTHIDRLEKRMDSMDSKMDLQGNRIDHLYQICIELLRREK